MAKQKMKRVLVMGDTHCGHVTGLTPASWLDRPPKNAGERRQEQYRYRRWAFDWYLKKVREFAPVHLLICMGDMIDGRQPKNGSRNLISVDVDDQCGMAAELIRCVKAERVVMVYGTPYHTGTLKNEEDNIAREVKAEDIDDFLNFSVNGLEFNCLHKCNRSSVPYGAHTPIARAWMWNALLAGERPEFVRANVLLRGHTHLYRLAGGPGWKAITCPTLQGRTEYGSKSVEGYFDFGMLGFDVYAEGRYHYYEMLTEIQHSGIKHHIF